jgi:hypothetical protein
VANAAAEVDADVEAIPVAGDADNRLGLDRQVGCEGRTSEDASERDAGEQKLFHDNPHVHYYLSGH